MSYAGLFNNFENIVYGFVGTLYCNAGLGYCLYKALRNLAFCQLSQLFIQKLELFCSTLSWFVSDECLAL